MVQKTLSVHDKIAHTHSYKISAKAALKRLQNRVKRRGLALVNTENYYALVYRRVFQSTSKTFSFRAANLFQLNAKIPLTGQTAG